MVTIRPRRPFVLAIAAIVPVAALLSGTPANAASTEPLRPDACERTAPVTCVGPYEQRAAYGIDDLIASGIDGRGVTVAVIDAYADPYLKADLAAYSTRFGLPATDLHVSTPFGVPAFDPKDSTSAYAGATTIDVEQVHAIAPAARIEVVLAKSDSDTDLTDALRWTVRHRAGSVVVFDLGSAEHCAQRSHATQHRLFAQGVAKGMTFVAGTGVSGVAGTCDGVHYRRSADSPASDPHVLAVGSTRLRFDGSTSSYVGERVFNERRTPAEFGLGWQATGSGSSRSYAEPDYQRSVQQTGRRLLPDVAISGSDVIGTAFVARPYTAAGKVGHIGGGIMAGSQWGGVIALAVQQAGHGLGDVNRALYALAQDPAVHERLFNDVTVGNNTVRPAGQKKLFRGSSASVGWDRVSGLGTPKADRLVPALAAWRG